MNNNIDNHPDDLDRELQEIEQMLVPKCEFHASEQLHDRVMAQARAEALQQRSIRLWPWLVAACIAGAVLLYLMPSRHAQLEKPQPAVAHHELPTSIPTSQPASEQKSEPKPEPKSEPKSEPVVAEAPAPRQASPSRQETSAEPEVEEEPVEMSEETRMGMLMVYMTDSYQQVEEKDRPGGIDRAEKIHRLRQRGEQLMKMSKQLAIQHI